MRPPKNPLDYPTHVTRKNGAINVYCVECERWTPVIVKAEATVIYQQNHWPNNRTENAQYLSFHCGVRGCWADVEYLLNEPYKDAILELAEVPATRQKRIVDSPAMKSIARQLRMEI